MLSRLLSIRGLVRERGVRVREGRPDRRRNPFGNAARPRLVAGRQEHALGSHAAALRALPRHDASRDHVITFGATAPRTSTAPWRPPPSKPAPAPPSGLTEALTATWEDFWAQPGAGRLGPLDRIAAFRLFIYLGEWDDLTPAPGGHVTLAWAELFKLEAAISRLEARIGRAMQAT